MVSGANVMDFRIENLKSTTFGSTRLTRRWIADLQKTLARFPALSRHELAASSLCSHLGGFTPKGRDRLGSCRSPAAVLAPEDAWVRLWQRRRVLNTLVVVLFMFRLVFWKGRPGYAATLVEGWAQRGRWGQMEEGTG